jgi:hypothetical protein
MTLRVLFAALAGALALGAGAAAEDAEVSDEGGPNTHVRGWLELARVQPVDLLLRAKLDSGALTAALDAEILRGPPELGFPTELDDEVEIDVGSDVEDGVDTVVFALASRAGRRVVFEREIVRWVRVKDRDGGSHVRPVVHMAFCIGGLPVEGEVGLTDRGEFNYPLLIGRRMLTEANIAVASWETFTHESRCYDDGPRPNES